MHYLIFSLLVISGISFLSLILAIENTFFFMSDKCLIYLGFKYSGNLLIFSANASGNLNLIIESV